MGGRFQGARPTIWRHLGPCGGGRGAGAPPVSRRATDPGARARDPGSMHACWIPDPPYEILPL